MGKKKAGSKSKSKVQVKPVKPAKVVAVSPVKPAKVVAVSPVKPAKVVSPAKQAKVEEIPEKQPEVEIEIEESKKSGRPVKNEYSEKEALAYVQRYLNKKLGLGPNVIPSRDNILEFGKKHGIISSSESSKNLAKLTAKHISRFIFAYAKNGLKGNIIAGSKDLFYIKSALDKNLEEIEKHGPRAYSMKFIFDQLKLNYTEEDEEDAEEE
jgi:hypothetical protein